MVENTKIRECIANWAAPSNILDAARFPEAPWSVALQRGDVDQARRLFVAEVRARPFLPALEYSYLPMAERWGNYDVSRHGGHDYNADEIVKRHYVGVYGMEHTFEGEIDWMFNPTKTWGDRHTWEWQVQFNRHIHWVTLARAWEKTGDDRYALAFERELISWIVSQCPAPRHKDMRLPGTWRTIDTGIRSGWTWPLVMEIFRRSSAISDDAIWLMVAALREHGRYLLVSPTSANFKTMEFNGLAHVGMLLPELLDAEAYAGTAIDRAIAELERQFYPDGCQNELASSYGRLSMLCTFCTFKLAENKGLSDGSGTGINGRLWEKLRNAGAVYGRMAMPDGRIPGLHDCDGFAVEPMYSDLARCFSVAPPLPPAPWRQLQGVTCMPWGGYAVMRREGRWCMLDGGPWGNGHQHGDALQVIAWSDGDYWCIDPGKPTYNQSPTTKLIRSAEGHNVVLMDGRRHWPHPKLARVENPLPIALVETDEVYIAAALRHASREKSDQAVFGHERVLMDLAGVGWLVVDRLAALDDQAHAWEWLWHFPAGVKITMAGGAASLARGDGAVLKLCTAANLPLALSSVCGAENPVRGWAAAPGAAQPHPIPLLIAKSGMTHTPAVCATLLAKLSDSSVALKLRGAGCEIIVAGGKHETIITLTGELEWNSIMIQRDGREYNMKLPPHSFL